MKSHCPGQIYQIVFVCVPFYVQEGVVVKLGVFDVSSVPPAAAQGLSTMAWKEAASSGSYKTGMSELS